LKEVFGDPWDDGGDPMGKFENYHHPERHYTHGPGAKWIEKLAVGFGRPYSDRKAESLRYTLGYRGYDLEVARDASLWQVGIYPRHADLPMLRRCEVYSQNSDDAVGEAK
jgi:hypothetical protein